MESTGFPQKITNVLEILGTLKCYLKKKEGGVIDYSMAQALGEKKEKPLITLIIAYRMVYAKEFWKKQILNIFLQQFKQVLGLSSEKWEARRSVVHTLTINKILNKLNIFFSWKY